MPADRSLSLPLHSIVDPPRDTDALLSLHCNASQPRCSAGRTCALDPLLTSGGNISCAAPSADPADCHVCLHKSLLPLGPIDGYGSAVLFAAGTLAGASGIGGGGL